MTDKHVQSEAPHTNMEKDPSTWVTGGEEMTGAQMSYLKTLSEQAKVDFDESLTKAEASERIEELQQRTGRGSDGGHGVAAHHESHAAPKAKATARTIDDDSSSGDGDGDSGGRASGSGSGSGPGMTGAQKSYLKTLSEQAEVDLDESLTKAEASERIDELQQQTGRGAPSGHGTAQHATHAAPKVKTKSAATTADDDSTSDAGEEEADAAEGDLFEGDGTRSKSAHR